MAGKSMLVLKELPEWLRQCNPNSYVRVKDLANLFNVTEATISSWIKSGKLLTPERKEVGAAKDRRPYETRWKVSVIKPFLQDIINSTNAGELK
jgi:hypothetical protein